MLIENIDIKYFHYNELSIDGIEEIVHIKSLPYVSIVQSKIGSYKIRLDNSNEYSTDEGGFFIAPSHVTQTITHCTNKEINQFSARYFFFDVLINNKYHIDDVFDFPVVTDKSASAILNEYFNKYTAEDNICDKMCCMYNIIKHLLTISVEKNTYRNSSIYPVIELIKADFAKNITISEMAKTVGMSESNLYSVFKKATGTSPIKYLNEYRLSVAEELLRHTDENIKNIAEKVGIQDQFYFSKLFKAKYSMSPQQYRKIIF